MRCHSNKYNAHKTEVDGTVFASKKEADRYVALKKLETAGVITEFETQVRYNLIPAYREPDTIGAKGGVHKGKVIFKECNYIADFQYYRDGKLVVEDVKGTKMGGAYQIFKIKQKLMYDRYRIIVQEV